MSAFVSFYYRRMFSGQGPPPSSPLCTLASPQLGEQFDSIESGLLVKGGLERLRGEGFPIHADAMSAMPS
jgi:hypothetical protein